MSLSDYTDVNRKVTFAYWLEFATHDLGSMRGGGAFKFGIYCRKGPIKEQRAHFSHDGTYSWYGKYGASPDEAFERIRALVLQCARAASAGDLEAVDKIDLGAVYKWKIAFLYQNRTAPQILPIYTSEVLAAASAQSSRQPTSALHGVLMLRRGDRPLFEFADALWTAASASLKDTLTTDQALSYFEDNKDRFDPITAPSGKAAGFQIADGKQIALVRANNAVTLFLAQGPWIDELGPILQDVVQYPPDETRMHSLAAHAPLLAIGHPAVRVRVPTMAALIGLTDAYIDTIQIDMPPAFVITPALAAQAIPLNQILFGPPGTGKTYATIDAALAILDPAFAQANAGSRKLFKARFDALRDDGHVRFVTFHQSFSYEDFVEGLRAVNGANGALRYEVETGVFKSICEAAATKVTHQAAAPLNLQGRRIWKMSLGNTLGADAPIYDECIECGYALLGYGKTVDFAGVKTRGDVVQRFAEAGHLVAPDSYEVTAVYTFLINVNKGDLIVVTDGNLKFRAIGEVTGDYRRLARSDGGQDYNQCRDVKWLRVYEPSLAHDQLMKKVFSQMTIYELKSGSINMDKLTRLLDAKRILTDGERAQLAFPPQTQIGGYVVVRATGDLLDLTKPNGNSLPIGMKVITTLASFVIRGDLSYQDIKDGKVFSKLTGTNLEPNIVNGYANVLQQLTKMYVETFAEESAGPVQAPPSAKVLIIDEINRGSVSRIFGELITLIEPSKREGEEECLEVTLPYSKERFCVPNNVYLIGTMNTADRSLAGVDLALRRRFSFKEMPPRPDLLAGIHVEGIDIAAMLEAMNKRIAVLVGRDYCIGHAYFLGLDTQREMPLLASIFRNQIVPLLQEYFFEDWEHIHWVLNDHDKPYAQRFVLADDSPLEHLFGSAASGMNISKSRWSLNEVAFNDAASYLGIIRATV